MQIILKPVLPKILKSILHYGAEEIIRIDLDEEEFEQLYFKLQEDDNNYLGEDVEVQDMKVSSKRPRLGGYVRINGVTVQCCYEKNNNLINMSIAN